MSARLFIAGWMVLALTASPARAQSPWQKLAKRLKPNSIEQTSPGTDVAVLDISDESFEDDSLLPAGGSQGMPTSDRSFRTKVTDINLGKESDEPSSTRRLFEDPNVLRLLGDHPRFIYDAESRPDPMIFPPVRNAAIYTELSLEADKFVREGKLAAALENYKKIMDLHDRRFIVEVRNKIADLQASLYMQSDIPMEEAVKAELPMWVSDNTRGVLFDALQPMCLVGDFLLRVGDAVPNFPGVRVAAIDKQLVIFEVAEAKFAIDVVGYDE